MPSEDWQLPTPKRSEGSASVQNYSHVVMGFNGFRARGSYQRTTRSTLDFLQLPPGEVRVYGLDRWVLSRVQGALGRSLARQERIAKNSQQQRPASGVGTDPWIEYFIQGGPPFLTVCFHGCRLLISDRRSAFIVHANDPTCMIWQSLRAQVYTIYIYIYATPPPQKSTIFVPWNPIWQLQQ